MQRRDISGCLPWIFHSARESSGKSCSIRTPPKEVLDAVTPVVLDWREHQALAPEAYALAAAEGLKLTCVIPLVNHGRVLGRLSISRRTETSFTPEDVEFLSQAFGPDCHRSRKRFGVPRDLRTQRQARPGEALS